LSVCDIKILTWYVSFLCESNVGSREKNLLNFIGSDAVLVGDLFDESVFPDNFKDSQTLLPI